MKKKGFTLIELLAVIVILAIIALIATPLVLKYIEKSRQESKVDSAYSFVRNLETEIANYSIKNNGKKYNGQPSDKGYYELESFNSSEIDTTVKGDKPNSIKVCLSSLGQVEKAMFEYGKYYVSYDGKKGSISDSDTYDNFSCSGSGGADSSNLIVLAKDSLVNFQNRGDYIGGFLEGDITELVSKIKTPSEYHFKLKDKDTKEVIIEAYVLCGYGYQDGEGNSSFSMVSERSKNSYKYSVEISNGMLAIGIDPEVHPNFIDGDYLVDFESADREFIPYMFQVDAEGNNWLMGYNLVAGNVDVLITDEDGNVYCDKSMELTEWDNGYYGTLSYKSYALGYLDNVYNAIANGKIITVKITQNIDGKDVVTTMVGNNPVYNVANSPMNSKDTYSLGNYLLPIVGLI